MKSLGPHSRLRIGGLVYAVVSGELHYRSDAVDTTDTENTEAVDGAAQVVISRRREAGLREAEIRVTANKERGTNPHYSALNIRNGQVLPELLVYVDGLDHPADVLRYVLIDDVSKTWGNTTSSSLNQITFHGYTGNFVEAGGT